MITKDKVTEIFCIIDEFCKHFDAENAQKVLISSKVTSRRPDDVLPELAGFWKMHWYNFCGLNHDTHLSQSQKICGQSIQGNSYRRKGNHGMVSWIQTALGLQ